MRRRAFRGAGDDAIEKVWVLVILFKPSMRIAPPVHIYATYKEAYNAEVRVKRRYELVEHRSVITKITEAWVHAAEIEEGAANEQDASTA